MSQIFDLVLEAANWQCCVFVRDFISQYLVQVIESCPLNLQQYSRLNDDEKRLFGASMRACVKISVEYFRTDINTHTALDILTSILSVRAGNPRALDFLLEEFADRRGFFYLANTLGWAPRTPIETNETQMMVILHAAHDVELDHRGPTQHFDCVKFIADSFMSKIYGLSDEHLAEATSGRCWNKIYHMIFEINSKVSTT